MREPKPVLVTNTTPLIAPSIRLVTKRVTPSSFASAQLRAWVSLAAATCAFAK